MELRWVNHASFIIEHRDVKLVCDPWLSGSAFADGWDLLSKSILPTAELSDVTHIWYSHEHPDHFAPRILKSIDEGRRKQITVLYQDAPDGKVLQFCASLGFKVRPLRSGEVVALGHGFDVMCGHVPFYDSWLLMTVDGRRILNLNDCVVDSERAARQIKQVVGTVDVLMSQFNDAEWKGNPDQRSLREASAREKLRRLQIQAAAFEPEFMIPFASFFYFSHVENFYLNDAMNRVSDVSAFISAKCASKPVVLYPGDTWDGRSPHDNTEACRRYEHDVANARPVRAAGSSVPVAELTRLADAYRERIKRNNSAALLWLASNRWAPLLPSLRVALDDLGTTVEFDWRRGLREHDGADADLSMHSESLAFVFRFDWGMDTLTVNGRFRAQQDGYRRFVRTFAPGSLNNIGRRFGPGLLSDREFLRRVLAMRNPDASAPI